jgi:hypothetical protein
MAKIAREYTIRKYLQVLQYMYDAGEEGFSLTEVRERHKVSTILTAWAINNVLEGMHIGHWRWLKGAGQPTENMVTAMILWDRKKREEYKKANADVNAKTVTSKSIERLERKAKNIEISILWGLIKINK